jgi:peroxiredoxin
MTLAIGDPAPEFALPTTDGGTATVDTAGSGRPLVVAFWCNHCPYVRAWEDRFNDLAREYSDRAGFVAVNANDPGSYPADSFEAMIERSREKGFVFDYAFDESQAVPRAYGAERTPELFVFGTDNGLAYHGAIDDSTDLEAVRQRYLREALEALLAGRSPSVTDTPAVGCTIKWRR